MNKFFTKSAVLLALLTILTGGGITSCKEDDDFGSENYSQPEYVGKIYSAKDGKSYLKIDTKDTATYYEWAEGSEVQASARTAESNPTVYGRYVEHQGPYTVTTDVGKSVFRLEITWTGSDGRTYSRIIQADIENGKAFTKFTINGKTVEYEEVSTAPEKPSEDKSDEDTPSTDDIPTPEGFVRVSKGTFTMGGKTGMDKDQIEASKAHSVTLTKDFFVCAHEVTQAEYKQYVPAFEIADGENENYPVRSVNWFDAISYCNKRSSAEGLMPCYSLENSTDPDSWKKTVGTLAKVVCNFNSNGYRLPTEAEWEYAARGGEDYTYSGSRDFREVASYSKITEVKQHKANAYGIYDMSGNAAEWCFDFYAPYTTDDVKDPVINEPAEKRYRMFKIIRGGYPAGASASYLLAVKYRFPFAMGEANYSTTSSMIGFRVVRTVKQQRSLQHYVMCLWQAFAGGTVF